MIGDTTTPSVKRGDLLLVASGRGTTAGVIRRAEEARALGARVFAITSNADAPLLRVATHSLLIRPPKDGSRQWGTNFFEHGLFFLLECVSLRLAAQMGITLAKLMRRHANLE